MRRLMAMEKRSLSLKGHRTSIALEPEFWCILDALAKEQDQSLPSLITDVDESRITDEYDGGLASALRVLALKALVLHPTLGKYLDKE
ncbi:MAG: ribbon-helix-helix domain-containing protein [Pseudomonadota bacterium]